MVNRNESTRKMERASFTYTATTPDAPIRRKAGTVYKGDSTRLIHYDYKLIQ